LSFDLSGSLRRLKPQRPTAALVRRADSALPVVTTLVGPRLELLLDTCVYIDVLQGRTPPAVDELLTQRILNHSTVALSELTHLFGRLEPAYPATRATLRELAGVIEDVPAQRLSAPGVRAFGEAGILAGLAARPAGRPCPWRGTAERRLTPAPCGGVRLRAADAHPRRYGPA